MVGAEAYIAMGGGNRQRRSGILRNRRGELAPLIPDHGKLMHMFLVRDDKQAFAHLHPVPRDSTEFLVTLPPLPAGRYRVYGDIVRENGMTHTLVSDVELPPPAAAAGEGDASSGARAAAPDPDDAWWVAGALGNRAGKTSIRLSDGSVMTWERRAGEPLRADEEASSRSFQPGSASGSGVRGIAFESCIDPVAKSSARWDAFGRGRFYHAIHRYPSSLPSLTES